MRRFAARILRLLLQLGGSTRYGWGGDRVDEDGVA